MQRVLEVEALRKVYGGKKKPFTAVDGISFALERGEILGLLGPNGSGKTTTIQMLLGTLAPTSGKISYFGKEFSQFRSESLQSISFASTYTSLPSILTIQENLNVIGRLYSLSPKESARRYLPLLERFGLEGKLSRRISSLSAGQTTRLMLVKAFFVEPKIVLLDEPTASLDPEIAHEICSFLLEERERRGLSILFTSHKMSEAVILCDRTIFLKHGKIVANDRPSRLAKSMGTFSVRLTLLEKGEEALQYAKEKGYVCRIEGQVAEISLEEGAVAPLLSALIQRGVVFSTISIQEPSLEDYFLHLAGVL